jgi:hypothetical protein
MFAERSLLRERAAGREPHADSWRAVAVARKFANGDATEAELKAAERAARAAADRAASDMAASRELAACWSVALDAETAAMESAWLAVLDAEIAALESAWSVTWETRFDAVCAGVDAERKSQVWDLLALMDKEKLP